MKDEGAVFLEQSFGDFIIYLGSIFLFPIHFSNYVYFNNDLSNTLFLVIHPTIFWFTIFKIFVKIDETIKQSKSSLP